MSGKSDRGLQFAVQTVVCLDCRALLDAVTRWRVPDESPLQAWKNVGRRWPRRLAGPQAGPAPTFSEALNRLPPRGVKRFRWVQFKAACPVSSLHRVEPWQAPDKCPRCGVPMEQSSLPYRLWD